SGADGRAAQRDEHGNANADLVRRVRRASRGDRAPASMEREGGRMRHGGYRLRRGDRGASEYLLVLAILAIVGMFVLATITSGTTAITTEAMRVFRERAQWNAYSGAIDAEAAAQTEVPPALELLLSRMQAAHEDWSAPVLTGVHFPP